MRVVQVIDRLNVGGAERVLVDLANLLYENNCDVTVVCLLEEGQLDGYINKAIPLIYLRRKNKYNPLYLIRLYRILIQFDVIHIHLRQVLRYVSLLFYSLNLHKKKVVVFHDHFGKIDIDKEISLSIKEALKRCKAYIGVSEQLTCWAKANSVNTKIIKLTNIVRAERRIQSTHLSFNQVNIVSVGNFRPQKNYEFLCQLIADSPNNYYYTIYGQVVDMVYYNKILVLLRQLRVRNRVTIITDCKSVLPELSKYHLGLHCATSETGPLVALEYLSMQLPFVAYHTGEVAKNVAQYFPQLIQRDFDVENWKSSIHNVLTQREDYTKKLHRYFFENYSDTVYVEKCLKIYNTLLTN
ncbi:glycosyltransferase [Xanthomarina sp.]|uniref:glycosyltransferase n=1 Tax=Xanthomarina sp. TaxID=1931211 RepID=UPI002C9B3F85|nr:glycosyltransferase [Xanthomarina sp.]HLV40394.1 glycosyltransferase [Xanthomarina sp.]